MTEVSDDKERSLVVNDRQESVSLRRHLLVSTAERSYSRDNAAVLSIPLMMANCVTDH